MYKKPIIYAMIPARIGSTRLKMKNLALINDKPMISYAIEAAQQSNMFDNIVLNSDSKIFKEIADRHNISFYHRNVDLGSSQTKSDLVVADFMQSFPEADIVAWINSISPFQTCNEISNIVNYFIDTDLDSLITVNKQQVHCNYNNNPVNYSLDSMFEQTQDLKPVNSFVYSTMMWKAEKFMNDFANKGHAFFCGKFDTFAVSKLSSLIVKDKHDLMLLDLLMKLKVEGKENYNIAYDKVASLISK